MKRDFAIRVDSLLSGVRGSLDSIVSYMKHNIARGNISREEFERYVPFIARSLAETIQISNDLHKMFPDIIPDELKPDFSADDE